MHPQRKQRLFLVLFIVFFSTVAVLLMTFALRENINLFYPPSKIVSGDAPQGVRIRAGGCVLPGSVKRATDSLEVSFQMTDGAANVAVTYTGILPDLFAEGEAAVVTGKLNSALVFEANEVLAKHDETYMPSEVADTMQTGADHAKTCEGLNYGA